MIGLSDGYGDRFCLKVALSCQLVVDGSGGCGAGSKKNQPGPPENAG